MSDGDALGYGKWDGGIGPRLLATSDNLVKLPDEVSFELGAMATDAGLTSYHAIMAVQAGAEVYGAEVNPETQKLADEIGLMGVADSIEAFRDKDLDLDLIVDFAGIYELMKSGQLNPPMNRITHAEIPGAIDKLRAGGVIGRFIALYE